MNLEKVKNNQYTNSLLKTSPSLKQKQETSRCIKMPLFSLVCGFQIVWPRNIFHTPPFLYLPLSPTLQRSTYHYIPALKHPPGEDIFDFSPNAHTSMPCSCNCYRKKVCIAVNAWTVYVDVCSWWHHYLTVFSFSSRLISWPCSLVRVSLKYTSLASFHLVRNYCIYN